MSEVVAAFIIIPIIRAVMQTERFCEVSLNFYETTWHNNQEDSHLHSLLSFDVK
jgi:hypothetical protein